MKVSRLVTYEGDENWITSTLARSMKLGTTNLFHGSITVREITEIFPEKIDLEEKPKVVKEGWVEGERKTNAD